MRKMFLFILAASITTQSFSQHASTPADTSIAGLKSAPSLIKISTPYNPLRYSYSLMTPDMKSYGKHPQAYYGNTEQTQTVLYIVGHILVSIVSNKLGYRYEPYSH